MAEKQTTQPSPTGETLRQNLKRIRERERLTYVELSNRLTAAGRPIPVLGLRRIERGERRVDVDDLMALCEVLDISPAALLLPPADMADAPVQLTPNKAVPWQVAWRWAHGEQPSFTPDGADDPRADRDWPERRRRFLLENQPYRDADHLHEIARYVAARVDGPWHLELDSTGESEHGTLSLRSERTRPSERSMTLEDLAHTVAQTKGVGMPEARRMVADRIRQNETGDDE